MVTLIAFPLLGVLVAILTAKLTKRKNNIELCLLLGWIFLFLGLIVSLSLPHDYEEHLVGLYNYDSVKVKKNRAEVMYGGMSFETNNYKIQECDHNYYMEYNQVSSQHIMNLFSIGPDRKKYEIYEKR